MRFEWEEIDHSNNFNAGKSITGRAKVIGGWIVRNLSWDNYSDSQNETMVFIADPNHIWGIDNE